MLKKHGDWMLLGSADEQEPAAEGTVEGVGPLAAEPGGGLVRIEERTAMPICDVRPAPDGSTGIRGGRAQC